MLNRFSRLRSCGIFQEFQWPNGLRDFGRFNLVYGWNGSGKTTLSRILRDLEKKQPPSAGQVTLTLKGQTTIGSEFPNSTSSLRVFNRDFVEDNIFRNDRGDLPPIYVLGQQSAEKQKRVEGLKDDLEKAQGDFQTAVATLQQANRNLEKHGSDQALIIKELLRSSGDSQDNKYNNYNRAHYNAQATQIANDGDADKFLLLEENRIHLRSNLTVNPMSTVKEAIIPWPDIATEIGGVAEILADTVISETIQSLKENSDLSTWVYNGIALHNKLNSPNCLFCTLELPLDRMSALEHHFNDAYSNFIEKIDVSKREIEKSNVNVKLIELPQKNVIHDSLSSDFELARVDANKTIQSVDKLQQSLLHELELKKLRTFEAVSVNLDQNAVNTIDLDVIAKLNQLIKRHNEICENFGEFVNSVREELEKDRVASTFTEFLALKEKVTIQEDLRTYAQSSIAEITREIAVLETQIRQHRLPAQELNLDLQDYLGHSEIQLIVKETGYSIVRHGSPAAGISEGESTAIALLYFLKSLNDYNFDISKGIVVLDDPVSSLDSNALYGALGFIQDRTQNAEQLFILTHNFSFFSGVRNWFRRIRKRDGPAEFYMLNCTFGDAGRTSSIEDLHSLLKRFESDYHYLFSCIYEAAQQTSTDLEKYYNLPNMGRRLLETFLSFRQPNFNDLWNALQAMNFDYSKKTRIYKFLNAYSHRRIIGQLDQDPAFLGEAAIVLQDLLDLMRVNDGPHYDEMVKLVTTSG